ncbi:hypothetical protein T08_13355 [Trichinella sp. T8]|nr:hypothetical protein T08_13355 [Trichinella sp. T8]
MRKIFIGEVAKVRVNSLAPSTRSSSVQKLISLKCPLMQQQHPYEKSNIPNVYVDVKQQN